MLESRRDKPLPDAGFDRQVRPFRALAAGIKLFTNVEDTRQFFAVTDAIDGPQNEKNYQRYLKTDAGARLDDEGVNFAEVFSDKAYLNSFSPTSLAHAYMDFLQRENLDLEMLIGAEEEANVVSLQLDQSRRNYIAAGTANHDLLHVLTQYGRDPLGEALLLILTSRQFNLHGVGLVAYTLALREQLTHPTWPVFRMVQEARTLARNMAWIAEIDWRDLLPMRVSAAREYMGLGEPSLYLKYVKNHHDAPGSNAGASRKEDSADRQVAA